MASSFRKFMMRTTAVAAPLALAAASVAVASSGASGDGATWKPIAKQAKIAAEVPSAIAKAGTLSVASDATYAPMEYVAGDGTTVVGIDVDFMKAIGQVLGLKVAVHNVTFDGIIPALQAGKYNVGASSFTDTTSREVVVNMVDYFKAGEGFYMLKGHKPLSGTGLLQICGLKVAVESGTTEESDAHFAGQPKTSSQPAGPCIAAHKAAPIVLSYGDQNTANLAVQSGAADVGFVDSQVGAYIVQTHPSIFSSTGKPYQVAAYGLAIPKGKNAGLDKAIEDAVNYLIKQGTYGAILKYWNQTSGGIPVATLNHGI